jgi:hypothetical protein
VRNGRAGGDEHAQGDEDEQDSRAAPGGAGDATPDDDAQDRAGGENEHVLEDGGDARGLTGEERLDGGGLDVRSWDRTAPGDIEHVVSVTEIGDEDDAVADCSKGLGVAIDDSGEIDRRITTGLIGGESSSGKAATTSPRTTPRSAF